MASNPNYCDITPEIEALAAQSLQNSSIDAGDYVRYDVKRGLRDLNGKGVLAGLTEISDIIAKKMVDGQEIPCDGKLYYRGKAVCIRVYSSDPVAHLHEYGWRVKKRDKRAGKLMEGKKVFDSARDEYTPTFAAAVEELADEVIRKI